MSDLRATILIVDDQPANLLALDALLEPLGHEVVQARSGEAALAWLADHDCAVALLDVIMPGGIDGLETARRMRSVQRTRHTPVLFVTASEPDISQKQAYAVGAADYISKPINAEILRAKVSVFVDLYLLREQVKEFERREASRRAREEHRQRLQHLFFGLPAAVAVIQNRDRLYELANPAFEALCACHDLVGHPFGTSNPDLGDVTFAALVEQVFRTQEPAQVHELPVRPRKRSTQEPRLFDFLFEPIRNGPSGAGAVIAFGTDVTDKVVARRQLEAITEELRGAVRARDEFLSVASHELRTPLTPLQLRLSALLREIEASPEPVIPRKKVVVALQGAQHQVRRLAELVNDLLDVSRMTTGQLALRPEDDVDLTALVYDAVNRMEASARRAGCTLEVRSTEKERIRGRWDPLRLEQVLNNLIANAIEFGAGKPIEVELSRGEGLASVSVRDHGIGIAADDLKRIFGRFERAVSSRHYGGLGLGLYIARRVVEAHGGTIRGESRVGEGARFTVELPLRATVAEPARPSAEP